VLNGHAAALSQTATPTAALYGTGDSPRAAPT